MAQLRRERGSRDFDLREAHEQLVTHGAAINDLKQVIDRTIETVSKALSVIKALDSRLDKEIDTLSARIDHLGARVASLESREVLRGSRQA